MPAPLMRLGWPGPRPAAVGSLRRYAAARRDMEWQMVRILLIFRLLHCVQVAAAIPGTATRLSSVRWAPAGVLLAAVFAESGWFITHLIRNRRRSVRPGGEVPQPRPGSENPAGSGAGARSPSVDAPTGRAVAPIRYGVVYDLLTARVELTAAVLGLLGSAFVFAPDYRLEAMAPLVVLATEQITGAAFGSALGQPLRVLVIGTVAVAGSYMFAVGLISPGSLGRSDVLVAISSFVPRAYLVRRGAGYLLRLSGELSDLGERLSEEEQRRLLTVELHNHLGNTFVMFERLDPADLRGVTRARTAVLEAGKRLNTFVSTGRFSEDLPLVAMLHRQVTEAALTGLRVELIVAGRLTEVADAVDAARVSLLEEALRAVLINVPRNAGVDEALLHASIVPDSAGTDNVELVVTDEGKGFPPEILRRGVSATRSLAGHAERLARWGGVLTLESAPGCTQVVLRLPLLPLE